MDNSDSTVCAFYSPTINKLGCFLKYSPQLPNQCYDAHRADHLPKNLRRKGDVHIIEFVQIDPNLGDTGYSRCLICKMSKMTSISK